MIPPVSMEPDWADLARRALAEDDARHDVTTALLGSRADCPVKGALVTEAPVVVAGLPVVDAVLKALDVECRVECRIGDGDRARPGQALAVVRAPARALLAGERVILNVLQHLSGIATVTQQAVDAVVGTGAVITDTRKTTPGLRAAEKYAVRMGGGTNHRFSLGDAVLWKDNHWVLLEGAERTLAECVEAAGDLPMMVEVETSEQLDAALAAGVHHLLLDNRSPATIRAWRERIGPDIVVEASGGIRPEEAGDYARAGADRISLGALTHSAPAAPIRLDVIIPSGMTDSGPGPA